MRLGRGSVGSADLCRGTSASTTGIDDAHLRRAPDRPGGGQGGAGGGARVAEGDGAEVTPVGRIGRSRVWDWRGVTAWGETSGKEKPRRAPRNSGRLQGSSCTGPRR